jgi:hypothetical protein
MNQTIAPCRGSRNSSCGVFVRLSLLLTLEWLGLLVINHGSVVSAAASSMWRNSAVSTSPVAAAAVKAKKGSKQLLKGNNNNNNNKSTKQNHLMNMEETNNEPWRSKKEWWKDPLALFDENDELIDPLEVDTEVLAENNVDVDDDFIIPTIDTVPAPVTQIVPEEEEEQQQQQVVEIVPEEVLTSATGSLSDHPKQQEDVSATAAVATNITPPPPVPNVDSSVTKHSVDSPGPNTATSSSTSHTAIPALATTTNGPVAVLPAVSTTFAAAALPESGSDIQYGHPLALPTMGAMLSTLPAVKVLAVLAIGKAIVTGINLPFTDSSNYHDTNEWERSSSSGNNKRGQRDDGTKAANQHPSSTTSRDAATATNSLSSSSSSAQGWTGQLLTSWFGLRRRNDDDDDEKLPPARQLMEELEVLRKRAETAEQERQSMEREYEKTSWQVRMCKTMDFFLLVGCVTGITSSHESHLIMVSCISLTFFL